MAPHPKPAHPPSTAASAVRGSSAFLHRRLSRVPGPWLGWKSLHIFQALGETAWHWSPQ